VKGFRKLLGILALVFVLPAFVTGQPTEDIDDLTPRQLLKLGKNYEKVGDIYGAIEYYSRYYMLRMEKIEIAHRLAKLYKISRNYEKAKNYYLRIYMSDPRYIESLFYHAQMLKIQGDYDNALIYFERFKKEYRGRELKKLVVSEIQGCKDAKKLRGDSLKIDVLHMGNDINKAHIEASPILLDDNTLLYASIREDEVVYYDKTEKKPLSKFYYARKRGGEWKWQGEYTKGPFNDPQMHTGNGAFSPDGKRFYFTKCLNDWQNNIHCDIWISKKEEGKWQPAEMAAVINDPLFTNTQPTIGTESKKGKEIVYFVSDRPRGRGGKDIWYSVYDERRDRFAKPRNLGRKINTTGDEITPFYDLSSRSLYFSSNGWPGLGGVDIFFSKGELTKWDKKEPENLKYPINTSYDDLNYYQATNKVDAFFTSNRPGGAELHNPTCCDDLYQVTYKDRIIIQFTGKVFEITEADKDVNDKFSKDYINKNLLKEADISVYVKSKEFKTPQLETVVQTNEIGEYTLNIEPYKEYEITISKDGYFINKDEISTKKFDAKKRKVEKTYPLKAIPKKPIKIENIYYQYDKSDLTRKAQKAIDTTILLILRDMPDLVIEISAHTDSKGDDDYNLKLSQRRAESVVQYLITKGIDKKRLIAKGYGEAIPVAPNELNGKDNPEGRAKNRRTEFKVLGSLNKNSKYYIKN
jgi:outer membrane protein OmpA-like peptidoglycan-associated protein/tetratricopeptide (TPR) repeat protein